MNIEKELKRGEEYDLISFDIFDSLIERDVANPTDIFYLAGLELFKNEDEARRFRERRIKAESEARKMSDSGEVNLKDIYRELFAVYGINAGILREREINAEIEHCRAREKWKSLFNSYINSGKIVILISDMYLSSSEIKMMLAKCGITGYEKLFVSNEYGCDKKSGKLFKEAEIALGFENCHHLHYGDSIKADYLGAMRAHVIPRLVLKRYFIKRILKRWMLGC